MLIAHLGMSISDFILLVKSQKVRVNCVIKLTLFGKTSKILVTWRVVAE